VRIAITHEDVPGLKDIGPVVPGDPLLAIDKVQFVGQPVLAVAARDLETARKAAMAAIIEYEDLEPVLDVVEALRNALRARQPHPPARRFGCRAGHRRTPHPGHAAHRRPGTLLPGNADFLGDAHRRRRHDRLLLDAEPHRSAETGGRSARRVDEQDRRRHAPHGRRFRRQGNPGRQPGVPVRGDRA
jgi:hypothetical protein